VALTQWGDKWVRPGPVVFESQSTGQPVAVQLRRLGDGAEADVADVIVRPR
jgi:hypothetical protein